MILPQAGVALSEADDGDLRHDLGARDTFSSTLGLALEWATLRQVHGTEVLQATGPGLVGDGDALWADLPGLPLAVFTADCFGVVVHSPGAVGVAHAGWRGAEGGVVARLVETMRSAGHSPDRAIIGPGIGPCCFEVGPEVAALFPDAISETTWGAPSVDLVAVIETQLGGVTVEVIPGCTRHEERFFSHRRDQTSCRQVAVGWLG
jgi:YfiH family protein